MSKKLILYSSLAALFFLQAIGVTFAHVESASNIDVFVTGSFRYHQDGKWRCNVNVTIVNNMDEPVMIPWICLYVLDVTYVDDTFEELNIPINNTVNIAMASMSSRTFYWNVTESGFDKEPKALSVEGKVHTDIGDYISWVIIPEFPSLLILPLFMTATLLAVILYRRKHVKEIYA